MTSLKIHPESASLLRSIGLLPPEQDYGELTSDRGGYGYQDDEQQQQQRAQQPMSAPQPQRRFEDQGEAIPRPARRDVAGIHAILSADQMCLAFPAPPIHVKTLIVLQGQQGQSKSSWQSTGSSALPGILRLGATGRGAGGGTGQHSALLLLIIILILFLLLPKFLRRGCHGITQTEFPFPQAGMS
jgi:hypothetical protein